MAAAYAAVGVDAELAAPRRPPALAEALLCGVTTVADHHLTWPPGDGVDLATAPSPTRRPSWAPAWCSCGAAPATTRSRRRASAEAIASPAHGGDDDGHGAGRGRARRACTATARETFALLGEVAPRHGLRRRTQANEQVDVEVAAERYGRRPLELLDEWGWLAPDVTLAHLCGVTDAGDRAVARGGRDRHPRARAATCRWAGAWRRWRRWPTPASAVGLGTSGGGSNDAGHLLADARLALQVAPLVGRPLTAREVLGWATARLGRRAGAARAGRI